MPNCVTTIMLCLRRTLVSSVLVSAILRVLSVYIVIFVSIVLKYNFTRGTRRAQRNTTLTLRSLWSLRDISLRVF